MSQCQLNHSLADVQKKLESQVNVVPEELYQKVETTLRSELSQSTLNEIFHLLKKYDLASADEQIQRNEKLLTIVNMNNQ